MTSLHARPDRNRILELQVDRALQGLSEPEGTELEELLSGHADLDHHGFDLAAAALDLAWSIDELGSDLPGGLRERLVASIAPQAISKDPEMAAPDPIQGAAHALTIVSRLGWLVAAACLLWIATSRSRTQDLSLEDRRVALIAAASDLVRAQWQSTDDPAGRGLTGELMWSNAEQRGFMRFRGLAENDKTREQYQLWIFDRAQAYPVDGGVFDSDGADMLVPIDAKLRVLEPWQFAVTVEKPGGVVVSDKQRVVALAAR